MNDFQLRMNVDNIKACLQCVSKKDDGSRSYLFGLQIQYKNNNLYYSGTNGNLLMVCRQEIADIEAELDIIIPRPILDLIVKGGYNHSVVLYRENDKYRIENISFTPYDGNFPDWRKILPVKLGYNGNTLTDLSQTVTITAISKIFKVPKPLVIPDEESQKVVVRFSDDAFVIVMGHIGHKHNDIEGVQSMMDDFRVSL